MDTWIVQAKKIMRNKGITQKEISVVMGKSTRGAVGHYFTGRSQPTICLLYTSPSPRDQRGSRMPSSA